ncbi:putative RING-H2 finger protein ATL12 [Rhododendron vialii]|uniref:putative RING-H2 finger protein ATL12 n=1 Tax=Rhododendron vialii TaxID=182163 RepID=UPI00265F53CE|nr:putative RING-H2 finger protein ATL12 [Rhododendron vialii]
MNQLILPFSLLLSFFCYVEAQLPADEYDSPSQNFQPSIAAVLAVLIIMFFLTIVLSMYTVCCHGTRAARNNRRTPEVLESSIPRSSGVDRIVIESLPFFKFSALRGLRGGLECAVCLSKFEDVEVLRLLPKCKHAFHINCVDQWLESHSSCPLCRQRISVEDLTGSNSSRVLSSQSEVREDSNVELFVQREDSRRHGSSRFSIGSSFRKFEKGVVVKEDVLPIRKACEGLEENDKFLHKLNHKIIMSDSVFKSRWSNLSSSDLLFLSSEMLGDVSSNRFPLLDSNTQENSTTWATNEGEIAKIKDGTGMKMDFETKVGELNQNDSYLLSSGGNSLNPSRNLHPNEKRSMSDIVVHSRFKEMDTRNNSVRESSVPENAAKEERLKRLWLPIARKTVQWYASRDKKYRHSNYTRQSLDV